MLQERFSKLAILSRQDIDVDSEVILKKFGKEDSKVK